MTKAAGKYAGMKVKACRSAIIQDLKKHNLLKKEETISQSVGVCWRCKTPIEIIPEKQWFINVRKLADKVIKATNEMRWLPDFMKVRLIDWVNNMDWDWVISRQRIFATPIPVWYCNKCGKPYIAEKDELPCNPLTDIPKSKCPCGSTSFTPETDVLDTWMDSSITPLVISGWPNIDPNLFPTTLRSQGTDIIKSWAYYTILRSLALTGKPPFKEIVINGMVQGPDGRKMSKSLGNTVSPKEAIEKQGPDALRLWAAYSVPGSDLPFSWKDVEYSQKFLTKFWNAVRFSLIFLKGYNGEKGDLQIEDRWMLTKLSNLITQVEKAWKKYEFMNIVVPTQQMIWHEFCDYYLEMIKGRMYDKPDNGARYTLYQVIKNTLKILAPFAPFFTEEVYHEFARNPKKSIHLTKSPSFKYADPSAYKAVEEAKKVISKVRKWKSAQGIGQGKEIDMVKIQGDEILKPTLDLIKRTIRARNISFKKGKFKVTPINGLKN
jgi:valyl-tRNA synthetase